MLPPRPISLLRPGLHPRLPFRSPKTKQTRSGNGNGGRASAIGLCTGSLPPAPLTGLLAASAGAVGMSGMLAFAGAAVT